MIAAIVPMLLKIILSKKMLVRVLRKFAEATDNGIDDSVVNVVEGALKGDTDLVSKGILGLVDDVVPQVVDHIENKSAQGGLGDK